MPTILIVEDECAVRAIARRVLERDGFHVLEAGSATDALRMAHEVHRPIALVLSDVVMPDMTGAELGQALRGIRADLPIVFMSGYAEEDVRERTGGLIAAGFVAKPFTPRTLAAVVRTALRCTVA